MEYNYNAFSYGSDYIAGTSTGPGQNDAYPTWQEDANVANRQGYYYDSSQLQRHSWAFPTTQPEFFTPVEPNLHQNTYQYANRDCPPPPFSSQYTGHGYVPPGHDWIDSDSSHSRHTGSYHHHQSPQQPTTPAQIHINPIEPTPPSSHSWDSAVYCCWQVPGPKPGTLVDCGEKFTELEFANHIRRHFEHSNAQFSGDGDSKGYCRWKDCNKPLKWSSVFRHVRLHLGWGRLKCRTCGRDFSRNDSFGRHTCKTS